MNDIKRPLGFSSKSVAFYGEGGEGAAGGENGVDGAEHVKQFHA